ncbi:GIY-YIG nuclease family protein [Mariniflexile aquimaris]|uniref:GIY-YIG nuclease family protein n=1 Tax=Mariniflexile aquimaris TaxID=881009 RepID=A0ABW3BQ71_9FLAO
MNYVYILFSETLNQYYVGESVDIENRIKQHNSGFYDSAYTKITSDWILYHLITCIHREQARKIEAHIKKMKSKTYIQNLKKYPEITEKLKNKYG